MRDNTIPHILALLSVAIAAAAPVSAQALTPIDPRVGGQLVVPRTSRPALFITQPVYARVEIQWRQMRGDIPPDLRPRMPTTPLNETSVLSSFHLRFLNGDHHVKQIGIMRSGDMARGILADNNGDDNYSFNASWWNIQGTVAGEISGDGDSSIGRQGVQIPEGPPNSTLALVGFNLTLPQDNEVNGLKIILDATERKVRFTLDATSSNVSSLGYTIQYAWVPNTALSGHASATGNGLGNGARLASQASGTLPADGRYILRGFELKYNDSNNSAQNLLEVGVNLSPGPNPNVERNVVSWQDNDRNERIGWRVDYSTLK